MPALRRLPPASASPTGTVATFDPTQPGGYAWELGTSFPVLLTQGGTIAAPTPTTVWQINPVDPTRAPFGARLGGGAFLGIWDFVFSIGYNFLEGQVVPGEPQLAWSIESSFDIAGRIFTEMYWTVANRDQTKVPMGPNPFTIRPFGISFPSDYVPGTDTIGVNFAGDQTAFYARDNLSQVAAMGGSPGSGGRATNAFFTLQGLSGSSSAININGDPGQLSFFDQHAGSSGFTNWSTDHGGGYSHIATTSGAFIQLRESTIIGTDVAAAATDGFLYVPRSTAVAPTGVPRQQTTYGGNPIPMFIEDIAGTIKLWAYSWNAAAWKGVVLT